MKPLRNYVLLSVKEKDSKLAVLENDVANKSIIVERVGKDVKEIKKGDSVILSGTEILGVNDEDGNKFMLVEDKDICAIR